MRVAALIAEAVEIVPVRKRRPRPSAYETDCRHEIEDRILGFAKRAAEVWGADFLALVVGANMAGSAFHARAAGADTYLYECDRLHEMSSLARAGTVASAADRIGADIVIMGLESDRSGWAALAGQVAGTLGVGCVSSMHEAIGPGDAASADFSARHTLLGERVELRHSGRLVTTIAPDAPAPPVRITYADIAAPSGGLEPVSLDRDRIDAAAFKPCGSPAPALEPRRATVGEGEAAEEIHRFLQVIGVIP